MERLHSTCRGYLYFASAACHVLSNCIVLSSPATFLIALLQMTQREPVFLVADILTSTLWNIICVDLEVLVLTCTCTSFPTQSRNCGNGIYLKSQNLFKNKILLECLYLFLKKANLHQSGDAGNSLHILCYCVLPCDSGRCLFVKHTGGKEIIILPNIYH